MKKIIVGIFGFALLFTAQNVFAANWNSDPSDCQNTVAIANYTSNTGYGSCWTSTSMSAEPGDTINVRIYYHNTSNTVAKNVRLTITKSSNSSTSHNFTGRIMSDNGDLSGNVNLSVSSSQSISFVDARWFPNQSRTQVSLPNGQSASSILSNGISIGDIASGWGSQGTMVAVFKVSSNTVPQLCQDHSATNYGGSLPCTYPEVVCSISNFSANPTSITSGNSSTLSWSTSNCTSVSISNIGSVNNSGSQSVYPTNTTTYTLTASRSNSAVKTKSLIITVVQPSLCNDTGALNYHGSLPCVYPPTPSCTISNFQASPSSITSGNSSSLSWSTNNCTAVVITPSVGSYGPSGSKVVSPANTTTYTLKAYNAAGVLGDTESTTVSVNTIPSQMTGVLTAPISTCVIGSGNSTCALPFSWTTQNPEATSSVTHSGATIANGNNGSQSFAISNGSQTYYLYNNTKLLDTETVSASCASGTTWSGSYCAPIIINNCTVNNFSANPTSITSGNSSTLSWSTSNCTSVSISNIGSVNNSGSQSVYPTNTTTYTLTALGSTGSPITRNVTVYVNQQTPTCSINSFQASPSSITSGNSSSLNWSTNNCDYVSIIPNVGTYYGTSGSKMVYPSSTTTYTIKAYGSNGVLGDTESTTVYVNQQPSENCVINNFSASDTSIEYGESSVLNWNTSDCTNVTISGLGYSVPTSGTQDIWPSVTKTYVLNAYGNNGLSQTRSVTIYVDNNNNNNNCRIDDFSASDTSIEDGDYTTLRWSTTDCDRVRLSGFSGNVNIDGSKKVYPSYDTTYTLTAYNTDGSTETDSVRIYVDNNNNNNYCYINTFTSNSIYINSGDPVTLRWSTTDCDYVNLSSIGNVSLDGNRTIYPTYTTTYTLRGNGNNTDSRSITINVNYTPVTPIYNANVVTTVATNISQTGAQLNGLVTSTNNNNANVYFEYGTTVGMGLQTNSRSTNGNTNFSDYVSGLSSNTIYYFQAVSNGTNGISRGAIQVFKTLGYVNPVNPVKPIIIQGPTVYASASPIMLRIENKYQNIGVGDIVDYTVYYKNISNSTLTNPMVQVFIPQGITLINISIGTYSESDRTLSVPIADLNPNDEGVIYLQGIVDSLDVNLAQIVTTAILVYTNPNGAQENAMAYVLNNPRILNGSVLGASAFFGNIFRIGLIGWLIVIIFIMLLILIARSVYGHRAQTVIHNHQ